MTQPIPTHAQGIQWIAGGAQGNFPSLYDGEQYLCAVYVHNNTTGAYYWDIVVVSVAFDDLADEPTAELEIAGEPWGWTWESVYWYVPVKFLTPPIPTTGATP